jgi:quinol monooxygenase YgiN
MSKKSIAELMRGVAFASAIIAVAASGAAAGDAKPADGDVAMIFNLSVKPDAQIEFEQTFRTTAHCARLEQGNVAYDMYKVRDQERQYVFYEVWRSPQALSSHMQQPYTKTLMSVLDRTLERPAKESLRFINDLSPAPRPDRAGAEAPPECR